MHSVTDKIRYWLYEKLNGQPTDESREHTQHHSSQLLQDFGPAYFDHVCAEYESLVPREGPPLEITRILEKHQSQPDQLTWGDLYLLEKYVLSKQPKEVLDARSPALEGTYRQIMGEVAYQAYLRSRPQPDAKREILQAYLGRLLDALHWTYSLIPERERLRMQLLRNSGLQVLFGFVAILPFALVMGWKRHTLLATVLLVGIMGSIGGFLSLQRRIQKSPPERDPLLTILELQQGGFSVSLAPLTGAIFAIVLFLMFAGGLLKGNLFPDVVNLPTTFADIPDSYLPMYGSLLLWSFVAGFAESFIPDTLDRLVLSAHAHAVPVSALPNQETHGSTGGGGGSQSDKGKPKKKEGAQLSRAA